ncbi:MAG: binary toxin-like calcium binding domain-containing protein [bacterium]
MKRNKIDNRRHLRLLGIGILLAALAGCGGSGTEVPSPAGADAPLISNPGPDRVIGTLDDSDFDGIPDSVELLVGTDPQSIDSDGDGLTDHYELWGVSGLPVGTIGSLDSLPDADGDGLNSALDRNEAGGKVLKSTSAIGLDRIRVPYPDIDPQPENDLDDDWIPSDFELEGFYYELDPATGEDWFVKWDGDISKPYAKTDPTKWSTDGDPWSDWEESTKINLDQRVKAPGDHPDIPAYPEIFVALRDFTVELNQDTTITDNEGGSAENSWSTTVASVDKTTGVIGGGASLSVFGSIGTLAGFGARLEGNFHAGLTAYQSGMITENKSGIENRNWSKATATSQNTLEVAKLTARLNVVNTGTLPATNPHIFCNLLLGGVPFTNFQINYLGELKPQTDTPVEIQLLGDGFVSEGQPTGAPIMLSLNQLRSIQSGAEIGVEVVDFEAETLVWEADPDTGRRLYINLGDWSPYKSAIKNTSGRIMLDFNAQPSLSTPLYNGLPAKKVPDYRVFGYDNTGIYTGSPPRVRLGDAFAWAFNARDNAETQDVTVSFLDPISRQKFVSSIYGWTFSFDQRLQNDVINQVTPVSNLFDFPIRPGNPYEYAYICTAPPPSQYEKPRIYWASLDLDARKVRAYSVDVRGIKEMRFQPKDGYVGEKMNFGINPDDPESIFFYSYDIPPQYKWTGLEQVTAVNNAGEVTVLPITIAGNLLGREEASGHLLFSYQPLSAQHTSQRGINFEVDSDDDAVSEPFDIVLTHSRANPGDPLVATLAVDNGAGLYEMGVVADPLGIEYNYLRKRPFQFDGSPALPMQVPLTAPLFPVSDPSWNYVYAVNGKLGSVILLIPELTFSASTSEWYVSGIEWHRYVGI